MSATKHLFFAVLLSAMATLGLVAAFDRVDDSNVAGTDAIQERIDMNENDLSSIGSLEDLDLFRCTRCQSES